MTIISTGTDHAIKRMYEVWRLGNHYRCCQDEQSRDEFDLEFRVIMNEFDVIDKQQVKDIMEAVKTEAPKWGPPW